MLTPKGLRSARPRSNLEEAVRLVLEANRSLLEETLRGKDVIREPLLLPA